MSAIPTLDLAVRATGIGASEIACIVERSPYACALDIYCLKLGLTGEKPSNPYLRWGHLLEAPIAIAYTEETGIALVGDGCETLHHPEHPWALATPDRIAFDGSRLVEIKTAGRWQSDAWGEPGTDQVPEHYLLQVAWQMAVTDIDRADIAVLLEGHDFRIYSVERDRELEAMLLEEGRRFWCDHVQAQVQPAARAGEDLDRYLTARYPRETAPLAPASEAASALALELREIRAGLKALEARESEVVAALKAEIAEAEGIEGAWGRITWKAPKASTSVDWKAIAAALNPSAELLARHSTTKPGSRRFLPKFAEEDNR